jgi:UDP-N-acetylmuramoylalanine--D-glutamate ligase
MKNYIGSKLRVKNQDRDDYLILNKDDVNLTNYTTFYKSRSYYFSLTENQNNGCYRFKDQIIFNQDSQLKFAFNIGDMSLRGEHNYANAMAVITAAKIFDLDNDKIREGLKTFKGVEHRLEIVRELEGVKYVNDSKATNVDSVWYALRSFDEPIFLIMGGQDKGNDYNQIKDLLLEKVKKLCYSSSAEKIFNFFIC